MSTKTKKKAERVGDKWPDYDPRYRVGDTIHDKSIPDKDRLTVEMLDDCVHHSICETPRDFAMSAGPRIFDDLYTPGHSLQVISAYHSRADEALVALEGCLQSLGIDQLYTVQVSPCEWYVVVRDLTDDQRCRVEQALSLILVDWNSLAEFAATLAVASDPDPGFSVRCFTYFGHNLCLWTGVDYEYTRRKRPVTPAGRFNALLDSNQIVLLGRGDSQPPRCLSVKITTRPSEKELRKFVEA